MVFNELGHDTHIGNLESYKLYTRPTAHRLYGSVLLDTTLSKHKKNVQQVLEILALNGSLTTWEMAKIKLVGDMSGTKTKEKEYRRLLVGRTDRGNHSDGILHIGLIMKNGKKYERNPGNRYRLTLHGILYCLDVLGMTKNQIDIMAEKYAHVLPKVFGKWEFLKSVIGDNVYKLRILSKGLLLNNLEIALKLDPPMHELMSYLTIKYKKNFEYSTEEDLANQISLWFYTNLLYNKNNLPKMNISNSKLQRILDLDNDLRQWYLEFCKETKLYYKKSLDNVSLMSFH